MSEQAASANSAGITAPRIAAWTRLPAALLAAATLGILVTASVLTPRDSGFGTHEQLGLPPCGWLMTTGSPCPSCGMTTSFALLMHGKPAEAFKTNPMGVVLAVLAAVVFWGALHAAVTGGRTGLLGGWGGLGKAGVWGGKVWWTLGGLWAASWVYTIMTWH